MSSKRWAFREMDNQAAGRLSAELRLSPLLGRILSARGHRESADAESFLKSDMGVGHSPWGLSDMEAAVARAIQALRFREKIVIYGDYDVDGVTSTALLVKLFKLLGADVEFYIPDRMREGYGPNIGAFKLLREKGCSLVITVDCGISSVKEAQAAKELGLDLIITDHHVPGPLLPEVVAVVNPKTSPAYPYDMLGGVGVAYKFSQALLERLEEPRGAEFLDAMLELVALGTVCDVAPLDGENRTLVAMGIRRLRLGRWQGIRSLCAAAGMKDSSIDSGSIGFILGPRLNAGGRINDAGRGVRLLLSKDREECMALAQELNLENQRRQEIEKEVVASAMHEAGERVSAGDRMLVLWNEGWHPGVIGLAASRVQEKFCRPTLVLSINGGQAKGSGRSRRPFHLVRALESCADLLEKFGGHEFAAGVTLDSSNLGALRSRLNSLALVQISDNDLVPEIDLDCEASLGEIDTTFMEQLALLQPFGLKNPRPVLAARGCRLLPATRVVGAQGEHLKLSVKQGPFVFDGIAFKQADRLKVLDLNRPVDLAFSPDWNDFNGRRSLQLEVKDMEQSA
jgi:single-stranded-DNA-specific exonuclease